MNGLSLLVALATVGVDVGWEATSSGKDAYTIRIESVVVDTLREGSAIESVVQRNDRGLRNFRIVVGPKNLQSGQRSATTANEVDYGWRPNESDGIDYYVQFSLERLETLARGIPLQCEVHPEVPEIDKIYVFVGDTPLPRELPPRYRNSTSAPRDLSSLENSRGGNVATVSGTDSNSNSQRYTGQGYETSNNTQSTVSNAGQSNAYNTPSAAGNSNNQNSYGPQPSRDYRYQGSSLANRYAQGTENTVPVPPLTNGASPTYDYGRDPYGSRQENVARQPIAPTQPSYQQPGTQVATLPQQPTYTQPQYTTPQPTYPVSGPANALGMDPYAAALTLQKADLEKSLENAKREKADAESQKAALAKELAEKEKSPKSLILTTLALFASIGANAYLGWLAWSFFWRFRDAASDLSRARSNAFPSASVVGH